MTHKLHFIAKNKKTKRKYFLYENTNYRMTMEELNQYAAKANVVFNGNDGIHIDELNEYVLPKILVSNWNSTDKIDQTFSPLNSGTHEAIIYVGDDNLIVGGVLANVRAPHMIYMSTSNAYSDCTAPTVSTDRSTALTSAAGKGSSISLTSNSPSDQVYLGDFSKDLDAALVTDTCVAKYAIMYRDEATDIDILPRKFKDLMSHVVDAKNQNTALKYMLAFVIAAVLFNMILKYDKLNYGHVTVLIAFCLYMGFYEDISYYLLYIFKNQIESINKANTAVQVFTYLKLLLVSLTMLFFPLLVFAIFDPEYLVPGSSAFTDSSVSESVSSMQSSANDMGDAVSSRANEGIDMARDVAENLQEKAIDVRDGVKERLDNVVPSA